MIKGMTEYRIYTYKKDLNLYKVHNIFGWKYQSIQCEREKNDEILRRTDNIDCNKENSVGRRIFPLCEDHSFRKFNRQITNSTLMIVVKN